MTAAKLATVLEAHLLQSGMLDNGLPVNTASKRPVAAAVYLSRNTMKSCILRRINSSLT